MFQVYWYKSTCCARTQYFLNALNVFLHCRQWIVSSLFVFHQPEIFVTFALSQPIGRWRPGGSGCRMKALWQIYQLIVTWHDNKTCLLFVLYHKPASLGCALCLFRRFVVYALPCHPLSPWCGAPQPHDVVSGEVIGWDTADRAAVLPLVLWLFLWGDQAVEHERQGAEPPI